MVVPWAILIEQSGFVSSSVWARKKSVGWEIGGMAIAGDRFCRDGVIGANDEL